MLFITWCCNLERMPEFMVSLTILAKKKNLSHLKIPEAKSQRREKKIP